MTKNTVLRLAVTIGAILAGAIHAVWPGVMDAITAALLLLAALPWLAPIIKTIEVTGVGKIELRELQRTAQEALGAAASAAQKGDLALAGGLSAPMAKQEMIAGTELSDVWSLALAYDRIRETQRSGPSRISAMTAVVRKMIDASSSLAIPEVKNALQDRDPGRRLVAYAFLYTRPEPALLDDLIRSALELEDKPFGQYWGILAIGRVVGEMKRREVGEDTVQRLRSFLAELPPGTDRHYELNRVLQSLDA